MWMCCQIQVWSEIWTTGTGSQEAIFLEESLYKVILFTWKRQPTWTWYWVDTSHTSLHWVDTERLCTGAQQLVGAGIGTETLDTMYNCCNSSCQRQSHIISSKNATVGAVRPLYYRLSSRLGTRSRMTRRGFIMPALTSKYRALVQFVLKGLLVDSAWNGWIA